MPLLTPLFVSVHFPTSSCRVTPLNHQQPPHHHPGVVFFFEITLSLTSPYYVYVCGDPVPFYGVCVRGGLFLFWWGEGFIFFKKLLFLPVPPGSQLLWTDSLMFTLKAVG